MADESKRMIRKIECPEEKREARLLIEWRKVEGKDVLNSISCDNPLLAGLDNWDCKWSCWDKIRESRKK